MNNVSYGPTLGIVKQMMKDKLKLGLNSTYLNTSGSSESSLINMRIYVNYSVNKHHSFKIGMNVLNKNANNQTINQFQGNVAYAFIL